MSGLDVLKNALELAPEEKAVVIDGLLKSLDDPDPSLEEIWIQEAERRLVAYREGRLEGIPMEDIFGISR